MTVLAVDDLNVDGFILSITSRATEDTTSAMLEELTYRTIKSWLWIVQEGLEKGIYKLPLDPDTKGLLGSVESRYADELTRIQLADTDAPPKEPFTFQEQFGDARVTVWATFRSSNKFKFHLNSDDIPQVAVDTWLANNRAIARIEKERGGSTEKPRQDAPPASAPYNPATDAPATPKASNAPQAPVEGAIVAARAPSKTRQYPDGQLVQFNINKVVKGTNKGSVTYNLWGDLGKNYALKTIYMTKSGSDEKSQDYIASKDVLEGLNLSVDAGKIEAHGNWKLICKVAHGKNGKGEETEFFNAISLTAI